MRRAAILLAFAGSCRAPEVAATGHALLVLVRAAGETPVTGARVELFPEPAGVEYADMDALRFRPSSEPPHVLATAVTDGKGEAAFGLPPPGRYWLSAAAKGFGRETVGATVEAGIESPQVVVPLVPGHALGGSIVGEAGKPLPSVDVIAAATYPCRVWPCDSACDRTKTDAQGRFRFDALAPGEYAIWYRPEGGVPVSAGAVRIPLVAHLPVHACRGGVVAGVVKDAATGAPLEGAVVRVLDNDETVLAEARTDRAGRFEAATHLATCVVASLSVALAGYAPTPVGIEGNLPENFGDGQRLDIELPLRKGGTVRGKVLGPRGPVAGARVRLWLSSNVTSDADGTYRFADLDPGQYSLFVERTPGTRLPDDPDNADIDVAAGAETVHDFRLEDVKTSNVDIKGRVVDEEGSGVPGARVRGGYGPRTAETKTDAQGCFALRATTSTDGVGITVDAPAESDLVRGQTWLDSFDDEAKIVMYHGARVRGRVRRADGSPLAGAKITAGGGTVGTEVFFFDFDSVTEGLTAADGSYELRVPCGKEFLFVSSPADGTAVLTGEDVGDVVTIPRSRTVSCRAVLQGSDRGIEGLPVSLAVGDFGPGTSSPTFFLAGVTICAVTEADGRFMVPLPVGQEASIQVSGQGYVTKTVEPGEAADLVVEMQPDLPVTGVVRKEDGSPAFLAMVTLQGSDGWTSEASTTDTGGRFVIRGVPAGDYALLVNDVQPSPVPVRAGTRDLEIMVRTPK